MKLLPVELETQGKHIWKVGHKSGLFLVNTSTKLALSLYMRMLQGHCNPVIFFLKFQFCTVIQYIGGIAIKYNKQPNGAI